MLQSMLTNIDGNEGIYTPLPLRFSKGIVLQTLGRAYLTPVRVRLADRVAQLCKSLAAFFSIWRCRNLSSYERDFLRALR